MIIRVQFWRIRAREARSSAIILERRKTRGKL